MPHAELGDFIHAGMPTFQNENQGHFHVKLSTEAPAK
jgi:hypothetical protein